VQRVCLPLAHAADSPASLPGRMPGERFHLAKRLLQFFQRPRFRKPNYCIVALLCQFWECFCGFIPDGKHSTDKISACRNR